MVKKCDKYTCSMCRKVYKNGWTKKEQKAEAEFWFEKPVSEWQGGGASVCDDCFQNIHPQKHPTILAQINARL